MYSLIKETLAKTNFQTIDIKGKPGVASACPVSRYVDSMLNMMNYHGFTHVTKDYAYVFNTERVLSFKIPLPPAGTKFVLDFDRGAYPDLVEDDYQPEYGK